MAQAIRRVAQHEITEEQVFYEAQMSIEDELVESKDAVIQILKLARRLHETEFLNMVTALLEQGTDVLEIVVNQAGKPQYAKGLKNVMGLVQMLGVLDVSSLSGVVQALTNTTERAENGDIEPIRGPIKLLGAMRDPDVGLALGFAFDFLRALGVQLRVQSQSHAVQNSPSAADEGGHH
ncbi:hypothetical protein AAC03nite_36640 [Alicyclobacillus acidoterrestris]|uniref:DUF1641 domain-containing protein n=1 Tax=Alicyclobacillus suci TaxID=2816080 RepID=UPI001196CF78|nr:DUF1641 domain-containing protein [Alicyclobacillus suci]GEO27879.1 hypothetical protein AAC03nite_36640 [Alicyclobacillus acidoterrestris]